MDLVDLVVAMIVVCGSSFCYAAVAETALAELAEAAVAVVEMTALGCGS